MRFTILIKGSQRTYRAYCPDLPRVVATGASLEEAKRNLGAALEAYMAQRAQAAEPLPQPRTKPQDVTVSAPDEVVDAVEVAVS